LSNEILTGEVFIGRGQKKKKRKRNPVNKPGMGGAQLWTTIRRGVKVKRRGRDGVFRDIPTEGELGKVEETIYGRRAG